MAHPLLNAQNVRELALQIAKEERPAVGFDRVGDSFLTDVETNMRVFMRGRIRSLPSVGKTIK